jgi:hypothetical protein
MDIVDEEGVPPRVLTSSVEESLLVITDKCALRRACGCKSLKTVAALQRAMGQERVMRLLERMIKIIDG